jgi:excisionase family DNA binding protein
VGEDRTGATGADRRRLTVPQAAEALGVTVDAVRGRIHRGKLEAERDGTGTVYVWVEASP